MRRAADLSRGLAVRLWLPVVLVVLWWTLSLRFNTFGAPPLRDTVRALGDQWLFARFGSDLLPTLAVVLAGLGIVAVLGIGIGIVLGSLPAADRAFTPMLNFLRTIPKVLLISPALVLVGVGARLTLAVLVLGALWPVLLSTMDGVRATPPTLRDLRVTYKISRADWFFKIVLPSASPQIMAGLRTSVSLLIVLLVVAQAVGATSGVGFQLRQANDQFQFDDMWAAVLVFGIMGFGFNIALTLVERRVLRWKILRERSGAGG